jgi:hypothetical protein
MFIEQSAGKLYVWIQRDGGRHAEVALKDMTEVELGEAIEQAEAMAARAQRLAQSCRRALERVRR